MTVVCLDTNIIVFGAMSRGRNPEGQNFIEMSRALLRDIEKKKYEVLLPTVSVGELLVPVPEQLHAEELDKLRKRWRIVDYDALAAAQFARMRHAKLTNRTLRELRRGDPAATRNQQIADVMLAATAIVNGAETLYTSDERVVNLVNDFIEVRYLPRISLQLGLNMPASDPGK